MPAAYLIVEMKITDPARYERYMAAAPDAIADYGGEYLVRGGRFDVLEGDWQPARIVMLRFPSMERARAFYEAAHYSAMRELRAGATEYFNMILVEGVSAPVV